MLFPSFPPSPLLYNLLENWVVLLYQQKLYGVGPYFAKIVQIYTISKFLYVWVPDQADLSHILVFWGWIDCLNDTLYHILTFATPLINTLLTNSLLLLYFNIHVLIYLVTIAVQWQGMDALGVSFNRSYYPLHFRRYSFFPRGSPLILDRPLLKIKKVRGGPFKPFF